MPEVLRGRAPAKVNLVLEVLGKRPDGYHAIDTVLQELAFGDEVEMRPSTSMEIVAEGPYAAGTPTDATNLAWRAFELAAERAGYTGSAAIRLTKNVPAAGGLGGGASDAACVLRLCRQWMPGLTHADMLAVASQIGSDEAFFLVGGTARATGRGECVEALAPLPRHDVVLFVPQETIAGKTGRLFAALGQTPFDDGSVTRSFVAKHPRAITSLDVFNAFERVAMDVFAGMSGLWQELEERTGEPIRLAGAGPTMFWIGPTGSGRAVAERAAGAPCTVIATATAVPA